METKTEAIHRLGPSLKWKKACLVLEHSAGPDRHQQCCTESCGDGEVGGAGCIAQVRATAGSGDGETYAQDGAGGVHAGGAGQTTTGLKTQRSRDVEL